MKPIRTKRPSARVITAAAFAKLTPIDQRKAIARDVLVRLAARQLKPESGTWVRLSKSKAPSNDLQQILKAQASCSVCALGGAICGLAAIEDQIKLKPYEDWAGNRVLRVNLDLSGGGRLIRRLRAIFGKEQLALIEFAFEDGEGAADSDDLSSNPYKQEGLRNAIGDYCNRHQDTRARFKAIFTQIAKHGDFDPSRR